MRASSTSRLINIALRGMTLASKFALIFFLAKFLDPTELGLYGLLSATIGYALYLCGLELYTFTTREILKRERSTWGEPLKNQCALTLVLYLIVLPLLLLLFSSNLLPWNIAAWFFTLLIIEHIAQELSRLLIAISEQHMASLLLFLRSGVWAIALTTLMFLDSDFRKLHYVFLAWSLGGVAAIILGVNHLRKMRITGWEQKIDWAWIRLGVKTAIPLLFASLCIRALFTVDRYWLASISSLELLGAYVLFIGIANAMTSFLDAGVFSYIYPGLISAHQQNKKNEFKKGVTKLLTQTIMISAVFSVIAILLITPLLTWLNKPLYLTNIELFYYLLLANFIYCLSMVPHFALYAQGADRHILHSHIVAVVVFVPCTYLISLNWPSLAVPIGLSISFFVILTWKSTALLSLTKKLNKHSNDQQRGNSCE